MGANPLSTRARLTSALFCFPYNNSPCYNTLMSQKSLIWIGLFIGSTIGSFVPELWGGGMLSISSIIFSTIGGIVGIYLGFKLGQ
jgi:hypothetical protein